MGIEVDYISKELIKPSSPTPHHLSKLKFSFIDQNQFIISIPFVLFYEKSNTSNQETCISLKQSLSKALAVFYPLAGRINNYNYADCNDEGALFIEAKANCELSNILQNRNQYHKYSSKLFPVQPNEGIHQYGSLFQITYFKCGGLVVAFAMAHMLGDALSSFIFLKSWAAIARGESVEIHPFGLDSIFPPQNLSSYFAQWVFKENVITKSFVFDNFAISSFIEKYSPKGEKLSRVLALSVFLLCRLIAATSKAKATKSMVVFSVNLRKFLSPPITDKSFGNFLCATQAIIDNVDDVDREYEYHEIARKIKDSLATGNEEAVRKLCNGQLNFNMETFMEGITGGMVRYSFSSMSHFPVYEVDFGWGNPEWVTTSGIFFDNFIVLIDTKDGQGIEVWMNLTEEDMAKFENDTQLLSHLSSSDKNGNLNSRL